jgi:hypothetical protein
MTKLNNLLKGKRDIGGPLNIPHENKDRDMPIRTAAKWLCVAQDAGEDHGVSWGVRPDGGVFTVLSRNYEIYYSNLPKTNRVFCGRILFGESDFDGQLAVRYPAGVWSSARRNGRWQSSQPCGF